MHLKWIPNGISILRIALVAPVVIAILSAQYGLALALFFVAGFSDGVDGYLAKRHGWSTPLGALLDPAADKLLMTSSFLTLAWIGLAPAWLAALVVLRDIVIVGGATAYHFLVGPVEGRPTRVSKLNTALELLYVLAVLGNAGFGWPPQITLLVLGAAVLVTVVVSGIDYVWSWSRLARRMQR